MENNVIFKDAWLKLAQYYGETLQRKQLDLMDSVLKSVKDERYNREFERMMQRELIFGLGNLIYKVKRGMKKRILKMVKSKEGEHENNTCSNESCNY